MRSIGNKVVLLDEHGLDGSESATSQNIGSDTG